MASMNQKTVECRWDSTDRRKSSLRATLSNENPMRTSLKLEPGPAWWQTVQWHGTRHESFYSHFCRTMKWLQFSESGTKSHASQYKSSCKPNSILFRLWNFYAAVSTCGKTRRTSIMNATFKYNAPTRFFEKNSRMWWCSLRPQTMIILDNQIFIEEYFIWDA